MSRSWMVGMDVIRLGYGRHYDWPIRLQQLMAIDSNLPLVSGRGRGCSHRTTAGEPFFKLQPIPADQYPQPSGARHPAGIGQSVDMACAAR